jgi:TonB family protein
MRLLLRAAILFCLVSMLGVSALGSDLDKELSKEYAGKTLTLRHFYEGKHLTFGPDGKLVGKESVGPWTTSARIDVNEVRVDGQLLRMRGRRQFLFYDLTQHQFRDTARITKDNPTIQKFSKQGKKKWQEFLDGADVELEIELPQVPNDATDVTKSINAIFLAPDDKLADCLPEYWKPYILKGERQTPELAPEIQPYKAGSDVSPPHALSTTDPEHTVIARQAGYQGIAVLWIVITESGTVQNVEIARPVGLGLDDKAVEAVKKWHFEPSRKGETPVAVQVKVEVSFRLWVN